MKFHLIPLTAATILAFSGCVSKPSIHAENRAGVAMQTFAPSETPALSLENIRGNTDCSVIIVRLPNHTPVKTLYRQSGGDFDSSSFDLNHSVNSYHRLTVTDLADLSEGTYIAELWIKGKQQDSQEFTVKGSWATRGKAG